jgi:hypothetical protein
MFIPPKLIVLDPADFSGCSATSQDLKKKRAAGGRPL